MKKLNRKISRIGAFAGALLFSVVSVFGTYTSVHADPLKVSIDGDPWEWENVKMIDSTNQNVAKWAAVQDDTYVYFYVQQNGGNEYGLPITNTLMEIKYEGLDQNSQNQAANKNIQFVFDGNKKLIFKNAFYGDIAGTDSAYIPSLEKDKYEIEFAIPQTYFEGKAYELNFKDDSANAIKSSEIPDLDSVEQPVKKEPVYDKITIDGTFTDWNAIKKEEIGKNSLLELAVVFDGDFYIYMKEDSDTAITWFGNYGNGRFSILTDTGRTTSFKLMPDSIVGIDGAEVKHSNCMYEIRIPESAIKEYQNTVSFGYYPDGQENAEKLQMEVLIDKVANKQDSGVDKTPSNEMKCDGNYSEWEYYPKHEIIQYSTPGAKFDDGFSALYREDNTTTLFGHVEYYLHSYTDQFNQFTVRFGDVDLHLWTAQADSNGNLSKINWDELEQGKPYKFYLRDANSQSPVLNINEENNDVCGFAYVTMDASGADHMEWELDLVKVAEILKDRGISDVSDMKVIKANYGRIGQQWVTIAGTSTGAVMGISICGLTVLGVLAYKKKKCKVA